MHLHNQMSSRLRKPLVLPVLLVALGSALADRATGQVFKTLHSFANSDGTGPSGSLILASNTLYGTASFGGTYGNGTLFKLNIDGTGFTVLHEFTASSVPNPGTNSDGVYPTGLILSGTTLYGTAPFGGSSGNGTVFKVNTDGTGFTTLHSFSPGSGGAPDNYVNSGGAFPMGGLVLAGNALYGAAAGGGSSTYGAVFALNTDGTGFTVLHEFNSDGSEGANPQGGLATIGNTLYGTTERFGVLDPSGLATAGGTIFAVNTDGTGFSTLYTFYYTVCCPLINSDGASPDASLILSGSVLYGTAINGGSSGYGTLFAIGTDGTGFTTLHSFTSLQGGTNSDGAQVSSSFIKNPSVVLSDNTLYGTAERGGISGEGTLFAADISGAGFTTLYSFPAAPSPSYTNSDGCRPRGGLILSGTTLYGTCEFAGSSGGGTVFSLSLQPQLQVTLNGTDVILSWPTNVAGFDYTSYTLQSTTNLAPPAIWNVVSSTAVIVNGQNTLTNGFSATQQFYRLVQ